MKQNKEQLISSLNFQKKRRNRENFFKKESLEKNNRKIFNKTTIKAFEITIIFYNIFRNNIKKKVKLIFNFIFQNEIIIYINEK